MFLEAKVKPQCGIGRQNNDVFSKTLGLVWDYKLQHCKIAKDWPETQLL